MTDQELKPKTKTGQEMTSVLNQNVVLTTKQTAKVLNVSVPTINRWKANGEIKFVQLNGSIRYKTDDIKEMLNL